MNDKLNLILRALYWLLMDHQAYNNFDGRPLLDDIRKALDDGPTNNNGGDWQGKTEQRPW